MERRDATGLEPEPLRPSPTGSSVRSAHITGRQLVWRTIRRRRAQLIGAIVAGIAWQTVGILLPVVLGWTIDHGIEDGNRRAIWVGGLVLVALGAFEAACAVIRHRLSATAYAHGAADLRTALVDAALQLDEDDRDQLPTGEIVARATSDTESVAALLDSVGHTVAHLVAVPTVLMLLLLIDPVLALFVALTVVVTAVVVTVYSALWEKRYEVSQVAMGRTTSVAQESIEGFKVIRGVGAEDAMVERFAERSETLQVASTRLGRLWVVFEPLIDLLSVLSVAVVLWVGGDRVVNGDVQLGEMVTAVGFVLFLTGPVRTLGERVLTLQSALSSANRIVQVISTREAADHRPRAAAPSEIGPVSLTVDRVSFRYATRSAPLLDGVSFEIRSPAFVSLEGLVGNGKSTLLALLASLRRADAGTIRLDGTPVGEWPSDSYRERVLLTGPTPFIFAGSIADNLRLGNRNASDIELHRVARIVDADEFIAGLPDGYASTIGERGISLSGGQRQRLALARALLARPSVLLLDGATSAIDPERELRVLAAIRDEYQNGIVIVVSPNPNVAEIADRNLVLDAGHIREVHA